MCAAVSAKLTGGGKLLTKLKKMSGKGRVTAGFYKGANYPKKKGQKEEISVAQVAYWNNFGTIDDGGFTPPRPFFTDAVTENSEKWVRGLGKTLANGKSAETALSRVGEEMRKDIINKIKVNDYPENSEITLEGGWVKKKGRKAFYVEGKKNKKGSHNLKPLKDTLQMRNSVGYSVNDEPPQYSQTGNNGD